jgi:hypothetical protein
VVVATSEKALRQGEKAQAIADRAQSLKRLTEADGWETLATVVKSQEEKLTRAYARAYLSGALVDQRQADFDRGYLAGMKFLLRNPEQAESAFNDAVRRLERLIAAEEGG